MRRKRPVRKPDLNVAPRQCTGSQVAPHLQLSGKISDINFAQSTLFSGIRPRRPFPVSQTKNTLKGRFQTTEEIQENAIRELRAIIESVFQEAFQQWKKCWEKSTGSKGNCFEWDSA